MATLDIVETSARNLRGKSQNGEPKATSDLNSLIYGGAGPKFLGWSRADLRLLADDTWQETRPEGWRFWTIPTEPDKRRYWNPVWDHLKGNHRGVVALKAAEVPFVTVDLDRHSGRVPARAHTLRVLKAGRLLRRHLTELSWPLAEVNPKNGSAKLFGVTGQPIPLDRAVALAERVRSVLMDHGLGELEVFPLNCVQVGLPARSDKITIGPDGGLARCQQKKKVDGRMVRFEAYSAHALLGAIRSRSPFNENALHLALKTACANLPDSTVAAAPPQSSATEAVQQPRLGTIPERLQTDSGDEPNALTRQLQALLEHSRRSRRVPTEAEALAFLKANSLYSGEWDVNAARRAARVRWVLSHIAKTFDPARCRGARYSIRFGKYDNWARAHVGVLREKVRMTLDEYGAVRERRGRTTVDWRFVSAMLSVLEFLFDHPNADQSVPQAGARRIWESCQRAGLLGVRWDDHKWAVTRDWLDAVGVIEVFDRDWRYGGGRGRAMKWRPTERFRRLHVWYKRTKQPAVNDPVPFEDFLGGNTTPHSLNYYLDSGSLSAAPDPVRVRARPPPDAPANPKARMNIASSASSENGQGDSAHRELSAELRLANRPIRR